MDKSSILKLGDRVQIKIDNIWYNTIVERLSDEFCFYISSPLSKQMRVIPEIDSSCLVTIANGTGIYEFDVLVLQVDISDNIMLIKLKIVSELRKLQRRNAFRVAVMICVRIVEVSDSTEQKGVEDQNYTNTLNLSELGMMFLSKKSYAEGALLDCDIVLDKFGCDLMLKGVRARVIRCEYPGDKREQFKIAVRFEDLTAQSGRMLAKFIMRSQRFNQ